MKGPGAGAGHRKGGNRFTGANMTAREAQTLVGMLRKIRNMQVQMKNRGVYIGTRDRLDVVYQQLIDTILTGDRLDEIPVEFL